MGAKKQTKFKSRAEKKHYCSSMMDKPEIYLGQ
jgi:hypothetical protein